MAIQYFAEQNCCRESHVNPAAAAAAAAAALIQDSQGRGYGEMAPAIERRTPRSDNDFPDFSPSIRDFMYLFINNSLSIFFTIAPRLSSTYDYSLTIIPHAGAPSTRTPLSSPPALSFPAALPPSVPPSDYKAVVVDRGAHAKHTGRRCCRSCRRRRRRRRSFSSSLSCKIRSKTD